MAAHAEPGANEITERKLQSRKAFLEFRDADIEHLTAINDVARRSADDVIDNFYRHLLWFDETRAFFTDPQVLERVKKPAAWSFFWPVRNRAPWPSPCASLRAS